MALPLASCATTAGRVEVHPDYCTPWSPIYVSKQDVLTDPTAKAILRHDEIGARLCGWKPQPTKAK